MTPRFDEAKHPRDRGRFKRKAGTPERGAAAWLARAKELPAATYAWAKAKVQGRYAGLERRYGRKYAVAIMGAGLAGLPLPVPGSSLLTAAPVVAIAELHTRLSRSGRLAEAAEGRSPAEPQLSAEELARLGAAFVRRCLI